jgi:hypothetical protein
MKNLNNTMTEKSGTATEPTTNKNPMSYYTERERFIARKMYEAGMTLKARTKRHHRQEYMYKELIKELIEYDNSSS